MTDTLATWSPSMDESDVPDAWHPDDMLLAPLKGPDGTLIGVLSVDVPLGGRQPDQLGRRLLEQFAAHAALVIDNARILTLMSDSEQLFRAMFDCSPIAIALLTEDRRVARVNPACLRLLGRDAAKVIGRPAVELSCPVRAPDGQAAEADGDCDCDCDCDCAGPATEPEAAADDPCGDLDPYEVHFTRPDGTEICGRVNHTPLEPGTRGDRG